MKIPQKIADDYIAAVKVISKAFDDCNTGMSKDACNQAATAILARLANNRPPLFISSEPVKRSKHVR